MHSLNLKLDFTDLDIAKIEKWVRGYLDWFFQKNLL
jgi:hypothetical protein